MNNFIEDVQNAFSKTGDAELKNYLYKDGQIKLEVLLFDDDILNLEFETEILYCKKFEQKSPFNKGYFKCVRLSDILTIENNHYTFSGSFSDVMKAQKTKLNLAFGLNIQNYTHLITFANSTINLAFIVNDKKKYVCKIE
ncbi:hypothetical protein [Chryseobacterium hispalense]|uniref:hypothetical protein n=1 Tax=Chryseobacterium hispalense TaxID=1453492 RepID=UPI0004939232|nr:hypothetical protein [Chryseobacterium hispalense]